MTVIIAEQKGINIEPKQYCCQMSWKQDNRHLGPIVIGSEAIHQGIEPKKHRTDTEGVIDDCS